MYSHFATNEWVTPFGLIFITAICTAWYFARRNASSTYIDPSHIDLLMPVTIIVGVAYGDVIEGVNFDYARKLTGVNVATLAALAAIRSSPIVEEGFTP